MRCSRWNFQQLNTSSHPFRRIGFTLHYLLLKTRFTSKFIVYVRPSRKCNPNSDGFFPGDDIRRIGIQLQTRMFYHKPGLSTHIFHIAVPVHDTRCSEKHERNWTRHPRLRIVQFTSRPLFALFESIKNILL